MKENIMSNLTNVEDTEKINIIKRQTDYSEEIINEKLKIHNGNIEEVIKEYMGVEKKKEIKNLSRNQIRYKEIRKMMDEAMRSYEKKKEDK